MGKIALNNINYIDIDDGVEYRGKTIEIEGDIITSICDVSDYKLQKGTLCVDFSNCWAIPGMIDMHTHITWSYLFSEPEYYDMPPKIIDTTKNNLLELRNAGITVCRDMGSHANSAEWVKHYFENDKSLPLILTCGSVFTYEKGHMCDFGVEIKDNHSVISLVRNNFVNGANFIKIASDPGDTEAVNRTPNPAFDTGFISEIVRCATKSNMFVACHTYPTEEGVRRALNAGVRTIEHAAPFDESMGKAFYPDTYYVPTFVAAVDDCGISKLFGKNNIKEDILQIVAKINQKENNFRYQTPASIEEWFNILLNILPYSIKTDQLLCIGSDAGCKGTDFSSAIREILLLSALGFSNSQVLKYAITNPCKALGLNNRGKIKENFVADLVILEHNPILDITTLLHNIAVVCQGNLINLDKFEYKKYYS